MLEGSCLVNIALFGGKITSELETATRRSRTPLRFTGKSRLGFYPLPLSEAQRIRRFLLRPPGRM